MNKIIIRVEKEVGDKLIFGERHIDATLAEEWEFGEGAYIVNEYYDLKQQIAIEASQVPRNE